MAQIKTLTPRQQRLMELSARERGLPEDRQRRIQSMREFDAVGERPMPRSCYALPETREYPIDSWENAQATLKEVEGTELEARVTRAVKRRYGRSS